MNRNFTFILIFLAAGIASAATPSPTPKPAAPKSSAPAAVAGAGQTSGKTAPATGETKVLRMYRGPGYFDADLALKLRNKLASKTSGSTPSQNASPAATEKPVVKSGSLVSQNP